MATAYNLRRLIDKVERLAAPETIAEMSQKMAAESLRLIDQGFTSRTDPYGEGWRPTKRPNPVLEETGQLRHGWTVDHIGANGFQLSNATEYAKFHQGGTKTLVIRRMIPTTTRGLGPIWGPRLREIAMRALHEAMR